MVKYPPLAANIAKTVAETRVKNQLIRLRMLGEEAFGVTLPQVTRSQAVARIADRTASQQTLVISDCC